MGNLDIQSIFFNFLWIIGLSVLLATWSYAYYEASISDKKVRDKFDELPYALTLDAGMLLFVAGLAVTESRWWARLLWIALGAGLVVEAVMRIRASKSPPTAPEATPEAILEEATDDTEA